MKKSCQGCNEFHEWSRRRFLAESRAAVAAIATSPAWIPKIALSRDHVSDRDVMVVIFLRGGMDGLSAVVPYGDPNLYEPSLRPALTVPPPGSPNGALDLDGFFGFAPAMWQLMPAYESGQLAIVHATGSPDPTRSHFDAFGFMEYGNPLQPPTLLDGWLARHLQSAAPSSNGPLRAVAVGNILPLTLAGAPATLPIAHPNEFRFPIGHPDTVVLRRQMLESAYDIAGGALGPAAQHTIETVDLLSAIDFDNYQPGGGATYPDTEFGRAMRAIAALIKAGVGVEAAMTEHGSWDTHNVQGVIDGDMARLMIELSGGLAAFHLDMQSHINGITLVVMSEFGRRADQNGSAGSDHGHGNCMFVLGGRIAGGQVLTDWTDGELLHPDLRYEGDCLDVTIDYRDILAEIVQRHLKNPNLSTVFPNYIPTFRGITS